MQKALQEQYYRVEVLEKALAFKDMTNEEREEMEAELEAIKQLLSNNEEALKQMQLQQRKTTSVAVLAIVMCVGIFLIYSVVTNPYWCHGVGRGQVENSDFERLTCII